MHSEKTRLPKCVKCNWQGTTFPFQLSFIFKFVVMDIFQPTDVLILSVYFFLNVNGNREFIWHRIMKHQSIDQSIKTHFYSAICREQIRGTSLVWLIICKLFHSSSFPKLPEVSGYRVPRSKDRLFYVFDLGLLPPPTALPIVTYCQAKDAEFHLASQLRGLNRTPHQRWAPTSDCCWTTQWTLAGQACIAIQPHQHHHHHPTRKTGLRSHSQV